MEGGGKKRGKYLKVCFYKIQLILLWGEKMKRILIVIASFILVGTMILSISPAMAGKPQNVIEKSNGFPSGQHFNLNIHGRNPDTFTCDGTPDGRSIFINLYDDCDEYVFGECGSTIQYVSNKKASLYNLDVLDMCAEDFDGTPAKVQLPYKVLVDDVPTEAEGYYVYGRILAKPNNGKNCEGDDCPSKIILYPNVVKEACNYSGDSGDLPFGDYTDCEGELALGLIVGDNLYEPNPETETYERFDPGATKGKGKSKATDITRLFIYVGWIVDERLDINPEGGDGIIDQNDIPADAWNIILAEGLNPFDYDQNNSSTIDLIEEWLAFQADLETPMAWYFSQEDNMWILNIADLVITEQGLVNNGTKLMQLRFYPVATTTFRE
jgi:hypothetical protein